MADDIITINIDPQVLSVDAGATTPALTLDLNSVLSTPVTYFIYNQVAPLATWTINHNLGQYPITQVFNSGSQLVTANVVNTSLNQTVVYFDSPISGFAKLQ